MTIEATLGTEQGTGSKDQRSATCSHKMKRDHSGAIVEPAISWHYLQYSQNAGVSCHRRITDPDSLFFPSVWPNTYTSSLSLANDWHPFLSIYSRTRLPISLALLVARHFQPFLSSLNYCLPQPRRHKLTPYICIYSNVGTE